MVFIYKQKTIMIFVGIMALAVVITFVIINYFAGQMNMKYPNTDYLPNNIPSRTLSFSLLGSSNYDPTTHNTGRSQYLAYSDGRAIMTIGDFVVDGTLVQWVHIRDNEAMGLVADANRFTDTFIVDFSQNDIIISFGREITEMQCFKDDRYAAGRDHLINLEVLAVTYSQPHQGSKVFFYQIPKTSIVYYELDSPYYFEGKWGSGNGNLGTATDLEHMRQAGVEPGK